MLSQTQLDFINKYVPDKFYNTDKLIKYLNIHEVVGNEVFDYVDRNNRNLARAKAHSEMLDDEKGYLPVSVDTFIRRIPFYFYTWDDSNDTNHSCEDIGDIFRSVWSEIKLGEKNVESIYLDFEYLFYQKGIDPYHIFNYITEQTGLVTEEYFFDWVEYLHLSDELGWTDIMPDKFITAYNAAREAMGLRPRIFIPIWDMHQEKPYFKDGRFLKFEGVFPCDKDGKPVMKWIGLKFRNEYKVVSCSCKKSETGYLLIEVQPSTVVYYRDEDDGDTFWNQVYAGPLTMEFDYSVLKARREKLHYTQQEVADAVGANIRTYQKWEYGNTQPDGVYLLRLMNWLDIPSVQEAVTFDIPDEGC